MKIIFLTFIKSIFGVVFPRGEVQKWARFFMNPRKTKFLGDDPKLLRAEADLYR